jgi:hypothetical protein
VTFRGQSGRDSGGILRQWLTALMTSLVQTEASASTAALCPAFCLPVPGLPRLL